MKKIKYLKSKIDDLFNIRRIINHEISILHYKKYAFECKEYGVNNSLISESDFIIISLTTYGKRINEVYLTIESLFQQTEKVNKIILWLSKEEFDEKKIPSILIEQQKRGLDIQFCEDLKSYKKLIPTLILYPEATIITVDDDYVYPIDFVEKLVKLHNEYSHCVCYYTGSRININRKGIIEPYLKWKSNKSEYIPSCLNFATGAGGILYPSGCFHSDIKNVSLFFKLAPTADDLWFKAMTLLKNIKYVKVLIECDFDDKFILLNKAQDLALYHKNVDCGKNDVQLKALIDKYDLFH